MAAFLTLGLVGVTLIALASCNAIRFAAARDDIVATLATGSCRPSAGTADGRTNVAVSIPMPARSAADEGRSAARQPSPSPRT